MSFATKLTVGFVGTAVAAAGVLMLVTPGPAVVVIPLGLAILATEFEFARRWLESARAWAVRAQERAAAVDPAVRRRRILLTTGSCLVVAAALAAYLVAYDWPTWSVDGWNYLQGLGEWVPELPGM
jgi:uncharacterized protein (TIGR02611 family)